MKNQTLKGLNRGIHKVGRGNIKLARNISYQKKKKKKESMPKHTRCSTASLSNTKFKGSHRRVFFTVGCRRTGVTT